MGPAAMWAYDLQLRIRAGIIPDPAEVQACISACKDESQGYLISGVTALCAAIVMAAVFFYVFP